MSVKETKANTSQIAYDSTIKKMHAFQKKDKYKIGQLPEVANVISTFVEGVQSKVVEWKKVHETAIAQHQTEMKEFDDYFNNERIKSQALFLKTVKPLNEKIKFLKEKNELLERQVELLTPESNAVEKVGEGSPGNPLKSSTDEPSVQEKLTKLIQGNKKEISDLKAEKLVLTEDHKAAIASLEKNHAEAISELKSQNGVLSSRVNVLEPQIETLNKTLKHEKQEFNIKLSAAGTRQNKAVAQIQKELNETQTQIIDLRKEHKLEIEKIEEKLNLFSLEVEEKTRQLEEAKNGGDTSVIDGLKGQLATLEKDKQLLQRSNDEAIAALNDQRKTLTDHKEELVDDQLQVVNDHKQEILTINEENRDAIQALQAAKQGVDLELEARKTEFDRLSLSAQLDENDGLGLEERIKLLQDHAAQLEKIRVIFDGVKVEQLSETVEANYKSIKCVLERLLPVLEDQSVESFTAGVEDVAKRIESFQALCVRLNGIDGETPLAQVETLLSSDKGNLQTQKGNLNAKIAELDNASEEQNALIVSLKKELAESVRKLKETNDLIIGQSSDHGNMSMPVLQKAAKEKEITTLKDQIRMLEEAKANAAREASSRKSELEMFCRIAGVEENDTTGLEERIKLLQDRNNVLEKIRVIFGERVKLEEIFEIVDDNYKRIGWASEQLLPDFNGRRVGTDEFNKRVKEVAESNVTLFAISERLEGTAGVDPLAQVETLLNDHGTLQAGNVALQAERGNLQAQNRVSLRENGNLQNTNRALTAERGNLQDANRDLTARVTREGGFFHSLWNVCSGIISGLFSPLRLVWRGILGIAGEY